MDSYASAGNLDRIYDDDSVIEAGQYDPDLAGVHLLGKDIRRVASESTIGVLNQILERDFNRLSREMTRTMRHLDNVEQWVETRLRLLQQAIGERL